MNQRCFQSFTFESEEVLLRNPSFGYAFLSPSKSMVDEQTKVREQCEELNMKLEEGKRKKGDNQEGER